MRRIQYPVETRNGLRFIDLAYPDHLVAIELDGDVDHGPGSPVAFVADRIRGNELEGLGWHVFRVTWTQLTKTPADVVVTIADAIGFEPARWRAKPLNARRSRAIGGRR